LPFCVERLISATVKCAAVGFGIMLLVAYSRCQPTSTPPAVPPSIQAQLDQHCSEMVNRLHDKGEQSESDKRSKKNVFYSWKLNTCVEATIDPVEWSYEMTDATYGFFRAPKWITSKKPLDFIREDSIGWVEAEGYWQSIDPSPEKKLIPMIDAKIDCTRSEGVCREIDAEITIGVLNSNSSDYQISSWDDSGIVAEDAGSGSCAIGHRLMVDFKSKSVSVVDFPTKVSANQFCEAFKWVNSYALHGGDYMLMGLNMIFYCDVHGASSAILSKVQERHGDISELTYSLWQDNGEGGPPATIKTPEKPYSQDRCARLFENKMQELMNQ
jgi:hypothetical protein